jgi:MarR family transcriptional regulator, organic hydroperoxide resistance regulator
VAVLRAPDEGGLSLKELSSRLGLAHSTVSGIVDRLERRGLLRREPDARDRWLTIDVPSETVKAYVRRAAALHHPEPLVEALRRATAEDRSKIMAGLTTLRPLLERDHR